MEKASALHAAALRGGSTSAPACSGLGLALVSAALMALYVKVLIAAMVERAFSRRAGAGVTG